METVGTRAREAGSAYVRDIRLFNERHDYGALSDALCSIARVERVGHGQRMQAAVQRAYVPSPTRRMRTSLLMAALDAGRVRRARWWLWTTAAEGFSELAHAARRRRVSSGAVNRRPGELRAWESRCSGPASQRLLSRSRGVALTPRDANPRSRPGPHAPNPSAHARLRHSRARTGAKLAPSSRSHSCIAPPSLSPRPPPPPSRVYISRLTNSHRN